MVIFYPEDGKVIEEGDVRQEPDESRAEIIIEFEEDECDPEIEDCFGLFQEEEEPSEDIPYELDAILLGIIAEVEVFLPMVIWFTIKPAVVKGSREDGTFKRAWNAIWIGSLLSYGM